MTIIFFVTHIFLTAVIFVRLKLLGTLPRLRRINKDLVEYTEREEAVKFADGADEDDGNYDENDE